MTDSRDIRNALNSIGNGAGGMRRNALPYRIYTLLEDQGFAMPKDFQAAAERAVVILDTLNQAQRPPEVDLLIVAADPKKLKAHLTDVAASKAMTPGLRQEIATKLHSELRSAAIAASHHALGQFVSANQDSGLYEQTYGSPGEQLVAQERRDVLNSVHDQLIKAAADTEQPDLYTPCWYRWTYTTEQWANMVQIFHWDYSQWQWSNFTETNPEWKAPAIDVAALSVGATHRFAASYAQAVEECDECLDKLHAEEEQARRDRGEASLASLY